MTEKKIVAKNVRSPPDQPVVCLSSRLLCLAALGEGGDHRVLQYLRSEINQIIGFY